MINAKEYSALPDFRSRILPVLGTIPALFGSSLATYVLVKIAKFPIEPLVIKQRNSEYAKILVEIRAHEVGYMI